MRVVTQIMVAPFYLIFFLLMCGFIFAHHSPMKGKSFSASIRGSQVITRNLNLRILSNCCNQNGEMNLPDKSNTTNRSPECFWLSSASQSSIHREILHKRIVRSKNIIVKIMQSQPEP